MIGSWWYSPYTLQPLLKGPLLQERHGALLRIEFADGLLGHADCHPWESCGDLPLSKQLEALGRHVFTPLLKASLFFARQDAEARAKQTSLLSKCRIPYSHWLALAEGSIPQAAKEGFAYFKVKGVPTKADFQALPPGCKLRLDFNSQLTKKACMQFLNTFEVYLHQIDFIEDPFPYEEEGWRQVQRDYSIDLACDRLSEQALGHAESARVLVIKPAVQIIAKKPAAQKIVVTSYLDHPLGQAAAAYTASQLGCKERCGLNSHRVYRATSFSQQLQPKGPAFSVPAGCGFGFDSLLEKEAWIKGG